MDLHTFERIEYGRCAAARPDGGEIEAHFAQAGAAPRGTFSPLADREPVWTAGDTARAFAAVVLVLACFIADLLGKPVPAEHDAAAGTTLVPVPAAIDPATAADKR